MKKKDTINEQCLKLASINITGDLIPSTWYKYLKIPHNSPKNKPERVDYYSILILSQLVYWYRPTIERDEHTGHITEYKQKFWGDTLQKSYQDMAGYFGFSKKSVKQATDRLVDLGLISKDFKQVSTGKGIINNVLYIAINADAIGYISNTIPDEEPSYASTKEIVSQYDERDPIKKGVRSKKAIGGKLPEGGEPCKKKMTYTQNTNKN